MNCQTSLKATSIELEGLLEQEQKEQLIHFAQQKKEIILGTLKD